jgi:holo-[acyl-carrier protein] synthase
MNIGVDIVEIDRIAESMRNERFLQRIFTPQEIAYCREHKNAAQHFAVRFAAKEAVWKAVGKRALTHRDIQVKNRPDGKPEILFPSKFKSLTRRVSVSLSHGRDYAVAMAIFNGKS